ncbi:MAG: hypothetical protein U5R46_13850 [Gammaproteobacteria bacterium]|nr:hypothetical protein [Gammaproteobacteria bacterium]
MSFAFVIDREELQRGAVKSNKEDLLSRGRAFLGVPVPMVLHDGRSGREFAVLNHGHFGVKLHVSDDGGRTWREGTAPAYPPKPDEVADMAVEVQPATTFRRRSLDRVVQAGHNPGQTR